MPEMIVYDFSLYQTRFDALDVIAKALEAVNYTVLPPVPPDPGSIMASPLDLMVVAVRPFADNSNGALFSVVRVILANMGIFVQVMAADEALAKREYNMVRSELEPGWKPY